MPTTAHTNTDNWLRPPSASHRGWRRQIKGIQSLLGDETDFEAAQNVAAKVSAILKRQPEYQEGGEDQFSETVDEMAEIATADESDYDGCFTACDHFNACLDSIYDWADEYRVIIA